jgi:hypothetical protein
MLQQKKSVTLRFGKSKDNYLLLLGAQESFLVCQQLIGQSAEDYVEGLVLWAETNQLHEGLVAANYT